MDTIPPPANTKEMSEHQTAKRVSTASNDSFSHSKKYAKSHVKPETKTNKPNFTSKIHSRFFRPNKKHRLTTSEISITRQGKKKVPSSIVTASKMNSIFLKGLEQVITTDMSSTYIQQ
jgi:hypothetical protein